MGVADDTETKNGPVDVEVAKLESINAEFVQAIHDEHELTFSKALKLYPKAIAWSAYVSLGVIMLAFDPQLMGNLYAIPEFSRQFGYKYHDKVGFSSKRLMELHTYVDKALPD